MKAEIDLFDVDLLEKQADDRGRVTIGSEYAGENVRLLVERDE